MKTKWIDLKRLKESLDFGKVLESYSVSLQVKGDQATGRCPLPTHNGSGGSSPFSAHLKRGIWQCFGCGAKGNVLDFAVRMEGKSPENRGDVRAVALKLQERFGSDETAAPPTDAHLFKPGKRRTDDSHESDAPSVVNQPLDFELKGLDPEHPYLRRRGFVTKTIERFGPGYCSRSSMAERIVIPIHDVKGRLIGYAGRVVDDDTITDDNPKYRFPGRRDRGGIMHEFRKSCVLYNAHRIIEPAMNLIVVEGFVSVWWLYQGGFTDVGALMGSSCSPEQAAIILSKVPPDGRVLVLSDGDDAGKRCAHSVFEHVGSERSVRWLKLAENQQPTDCTEHDLRKLIPV